MDSSNKKKWKLFLKKVKKKDVTFELVDYGVHLDSQFKHHYFLMRIAELSERSSGKGNGHLVFLAVPVNGEFRILGLNYRPFLFSY
jgi:hypothetical protein